MSFAKDLRASVLQAAMQGKLTEQLETDTPVAELLNQISLTTKKKITLVEDDELPDGWCSVKITDVVTLYTGNSISESVKTARYCGLKDGYDYIGTKDVNFDHTICYDNGVKIPFDEPNFRYAEKYATLLCIEGGSAGRKIAILDKRVCFGNKLCAFHPIDIESKFLYFFLQSPHFLGVFANNISGIIGGVSINKIKQMTIPLPPIEEQKRIVQRIEEIMSHIDELEAIEEELKKLKEAFPDDMKAAVLQAAMQGKLTEQLDTDSSVDELLENIAEEREKLVKEGKIKKSKKTDDAPINDVPFDIKHNWRWVKLSQIAKSITAGGDKPDDCLKTKTSTCIYPIFANGEINDGLFGYTAENRIQEKALTVSGRGTIGFTRVREPNFTPIVRLLVITLIDNTVNFEFLSYALNFLAETGVGSAVKQLTVPMIVDKLIPLPPLEEQDRIVAKLEKILPLITDLS